MVTSASDMAKIQNALPFWVSLALIPVAWIGASYGGWTVLLLPFLTWYLFSGIDLALGSIIDREISLEDQLFLPKYVHQNLESTKLSEGQSLVKKSETLLESEPKTTEASLFSPFVVLSFSGILILILTFLDYKKKRQSKLLDALLFLITGIVGLIVLLLWFATDHSATAFNYNLLWAFAPNIFMVPVVYKKTPVRWLSRYIKFLILLIILMGIHVLSGIQVFSLALLPFIFALVIRYIYLLFHFCFQCICLMYHCEYNFFYNTDLIDLDDNFAYQYRNNYCLLWYCETHEANLLMKHSVEITYHNRRDFLRNYI